MEKGERRKEKGGHTAWLPAPKQIVENSEGAEGEKRRYLGIGGERKAASYLVNSSK